MRYIGIRHRVKVTAEGEARPTQVCISEDGKERTFDLDEEQDELAYVHGKYPTHWRPATPDDNLDTAHPLHKKERKVKGSEEPVWYIADEFDGLKPDDTVAMILGGSGDRLAFAIARKAERIGARLIRIPPAMLKSARGAADKDDDAKLLARLAQKNPEVFYPITPRDLKLIMVRECQRALTDAMKARIGCEQRLRQRAIGQPFLSAEGGFPEGSIEDAFDKVKATDPILDGLQKEEVRRENELAKALDKLDIYTDIFGEVEGCGTRISARLISAIITVRRFEVKPEQVVRAGEKSPSELKAEIGRCLTVGQYHDDKPKAAHLFPENSSGFQRILAVAKWKRENGKADEAALLTEAIGLMQQQRKLTLRARSKSEAKFRKFCGVGLTADGKFLRKRRNEVCNWNPTARQALYLLAEQMNRRPNSVWGQKLRDNKATLRVTHPEVTLTEAGKKRYTNGHIHKMSIWKTLGKFATWLYGAWVKIENGTPPQKVQVKAAA